MNVYTNSPTGFKEIQRKALWKNVVLLAACLILGVGISFYNASGSDFSTLPLLLPILVAALGFGTYKGMNRQKNLFNSYRLTVTEEYLLREQHNTPPIKIYGQDVQEITRGKNGSMVVKGKNPSDLILVYHQLENLSNLEVDLSRFGQIKEAKDASFLAKYAFAIAPGMMVLLATVYIAENRILVALAGTAVVIFLGWTFFQIQTNKNIDSKTKRGSWWCLVVILSVLGIMYTKLF